VNFVVKKYFSVVLQLVGKHTPLFGGLPGRERVTGGKKTRAGFDYSCEKFECVVEAAAVWQAKQSFLGVRLKYVCGWG